MTEFFLRVIIAMISFCFSVSAYVAIIFSGDNAPQPSLRASAAGFFNQEIIAGVAVMLLVAISIFWLVKRPPQITPFDLLLVVAPISLWSLLLLIHLV